MGCCGRCQHIRCWINISIIARQPVINHFEPHITLVHIPYPKSRFSSHHWDCNFRRCYTHDLAVWNGCNPADRRCVANKASSVRKFLFYLINGWHTLLKAIHALLPTSPVPCLSPAANSDRKKTPTPGLTSPTISTT